MSKVNVNIEPKYLSLAQLSKYSGLSVATLRHQVRWGGLPAYRVGGRGKILVAVDDFDNWISRHRLDTGEDLNTLVDEVIQGVLSGAQSD